LELGFKNDFSMQLRIHGLPIGLAFASLSILIGCGQNIPEKNQPRAIKGVLDLSNWDFEKDGPVEFSGEYEFYWQQHLASESFSRANLPKRSGFIKVPGYWKGHKLNGVKLPGAGYATYRLTVLLKDSLAPKLAFKFLDMGTAYAVFANGKKILSAGKAGVTAETTVPRYFPQAVDFVPDSNAVELIYQVSNFHHTRGGAWEAVCLGTREQINNIRERRMFLDLLLFGSILIMGLYHLAIFGFRKNDLSSCFFGLFCLMIAVRLLTTVERFLLHLFPEMSWELFVKVEYLSYYLAVPVFALFLYKLFSQDIHKAVVFLVLAVGLVFSGIVCVTPARVFTRTLFAYQLFNWLCMAYTLFMIVLCATRKREGAAIILIGLLFLFATVINDMLDVNVVIQTGHFVHLGLFVFIFSHAFMLSFRYTRAFKTIDFQRLELEKANARYKNELLERRRAEATIRELEKQRLENEKLAASGRMAARIAHEINNPLGAIKTAFSLLEPAVPKEHRHHHYLGKIEKEIDRIARIVRQMLDLYKPDTDAPKEFRVDQTVKEILTLVKPEERAVKFDLDLAQGKITLPENMLRQILYNLALNAVEASPADGTIRITAAIAANRLHIAVADQGEGIPAEIGDRIFEPFFTTKRISANGGAGLGLSVCKTLVEAMAGEISFTSQPGKGTEFKISLPLNGVKAT
jgi:signal transduction histidine kinase